MLCRLITTFYHAIKIITFKQTLSVFIFSKFEKVPGSAVFKKKQIDRAKVIEYNSYRRQLLLMNIYLKGE